MTKDLGCNGNLFGGNMMAWIDEAAAIYALTMTKEKRMVTVKFDEMVFKKAVKEGDIVEFYCDHASMGESSISFHVGALVNGQEVFSTNCVFVAVDENGKKKKIDMDYFGCKGE
jgi:acyl-CoA thioesterase YciA